MPNYEVHYLSVSDADAIIIRYENSGDQYVVLIDAGNVSDSDKIKNYIWNHWKTYTIDLAICTHPDSDHKGGFFGLLNDRDVIINEFWLNIWGIERSGFFNGREKWAKGFENQRV